MSSRHRKRDQGLPPRRERTAADLDAALDGRAGGPSEPLDELLAAARAPARPDELTGLTAAFDAVRNPPPTTATKVRRGLLRVGAVTAATKIVVLSAVGAAAVGGVVVAGATGHLPGQRPGPRPDASPTPSISASPGVSSTPSRSGSASEAGTSGASSASSAPRTTGSDRPSVSTGASRTVGAASVPALCRQWLALPPGAGPLREQPKFDVLVRVAGSAADVTGYCRRLEVGASTTITKPVPTRRPATSRRPLPTITRSTTSGTSTEPGPNN